MLLSFLLAALVSPALAVVAPIGRTAPVVPTPTVVAPIARTAPVVPTHAVVAPIARTASVVPTHAVVAPIARTAPVVRPQEPRQQQVGVEVWPEDWWTDMPALELTGTWLFDAESSDPMISAWQEAEVRYEINQQAAFIVLDFQVKGMQSNSQVYRWDSSIQRFERGGRQVEEAARWAEAGRKLEIVGRHWDPTAPEEKVEYRFSYEMRNDVLTFVQEDPSGTTVWRFTRERPPR